MHLRSEEWVFGPANPYSKAERAWYARHAPTVDRWLTELEESDDRKWWPSAGHAAFCLVSNRELNVLEPTWDGFHVGEFLFSDIWESGTHSSFGSHEAFFDHLVEALRRFGSDGLIEPEAAARWRAEMFGMRDDFVRCYDEATGELESISIAHRHRRPREAPPPRMISTPKSAGPTSPHASRGHGRRRTRHPRRRVRRRRS